MLRKAIIRFFAGALFYIFNRIEFRYIITDDFASIVTRCRRLALCLLGAKIPSSAIVRSNQVIQCPWNLEMGKRSKIGCYSQLFLYDKLKIGDDVEIGSSLIVHTSEHIFSDSKKSICSQGSSYSPVTIGSNVYIGSRVTILPGVNIGNEIIIAAGSVVTENLNSGYIYGGVPAKKIKKLFAESNN